MQRNDAEKMRILHVIETLAQEGGGADRFCFELAVEQARLGHEVTVLTFDRSERPSRFHSDYLTLKKVWQSGHFQKKTGMSVLFKRQLDQALPESDVVHVHGAWRIIQYWARRASRVHNVPLIYQPHGSFENHRMKSKKKAKYIWYKMFEASNLRQANIIICESQRSYDNLLEILNGADSERRLRLLPCGTRIGENSCDPFAFHKKYSFSSDLKYILYLGRIDGHKGLQNLIAAYSRITNEEQDINLLIVGPDVDGTRKQLKGYVERRNISNVFFMPMETDECVKESLFSSAKCFVLPSFSENFGITVLEALKWQCPVIASRETGWAWLEERGAGLVCAPTENSLYLALRKFSRLEVDEVQKMKGNGLVVVRNYEWSVIASDCIRLYYEVV